MEFRDGCDEGISSFEKYSREMEHFACHGYVVLPNFWKGDEINVLQQECDGLHGEKICLHGSLSTTSCILEPMGRFNNSDHACRFDRSVYNRERGAVYKRYGVTEDFQDPITSAFTPASKMRAAAAAERKQTDMMTMMENLQRQLQDLEEKHEKPKISQIELSRMRKNRF